MRDFLDCYYLHQQHLHIGALAWAAFAKDPGLTPELIVDWASRGNRFRPEDLAEVRLTQHVNLPDLKRSWLEALREARELISKLPIADAGCLYLDRQGKPVTPDPDDASFSKLSRHFGSLKGAWPRIVEDRPG